MNLILFTRDELAEGIDADDPRVAHVREVLRFAPGEPFDIGVIDGPRGKAALAEVCEGRIRLDYTLGEEPPPLYPITVIVGMPRPQTARRLLRELSTLGVARILFAVTNRSEKGYATSRLWTTGEYRRHVVSGVEQAFSTHLPEIRRFDTLEDALAQRTGQGMLLALDNYEAGSTLGSIDAVSPPIVLAVGAERGWSAAERGRLLDAGFALYSLGDRVLRVETAAIVGVSVVLERLGIV